MCAMRSRRGLEIEQSQGFNPYRFGFIGSSDTHNAAGPFEESRYFSKVGLMDGKPRAARFRAAGRAAPGTTTSRRTMRRATRRWGASGLTGVWAEENTRESIFAGLRRKETFATSGPRMRVRFFAGYEFRRTASRIGTTWCAKPTRAACRWAATCCNEARVRRSFSRGHCAIRTPAGCNACRS